jgi:vancomycin permeability regulator SanA
MYAIVFGYGQKQNGKIDEQTKDRCQRAVWLYIIGKIEKIYLTVSASINGVSMASEMKSFLVSRSVSEADIIVERRGGNTAGEMDVFLSLVPSGSKVVFISTWYHIPRIFWLALWRISLSCFSFGIAWRYAHFKADVLIEFAKILKAVLCPRKSAKVFL